MPYHGNSSISDGEVPLSPGDVHWKTMFGRAVSRDPAIEALLEIKQFDDSFTDSSSQQQVVELIISGFCLFYRSFFYRNLVLEKWEGLSVGLLLIGSNFVNK